LSHTDSPYHFPPGRQLQSLTHAASGYKKVLEENRKLYNLVQDLKGDCVTVGNSSLDFSPLRLLVIWKTEIIFGP